MMLRVRCLILCASCLPIPHEAWPALVVTDEYFPGKLAFQSPRTKLEQLAQCAGEHGGLKLTANARAALMQRLSGAAGSGANTTPLGAPGLGMPGQRKSLC